MSACQLFLLLCCLMAVTANVLYSLPTDGENIDGEIEDVDKRGRNPYSWMSQKGKSDKRASRNPYSWMTTEGKRARNPYSWMARDDQISKRSVRFADDVFRQPRNPYSWQYTMFEKRTRNPYSWMHE